MFAFKKASNLFLSSPLGASSLRRSFAAPPGSDKPVNKKSRGPVLQPEPQKLYVTLSTPTETFFRNKEVSSVTVPAVDGASEFLFAAVASITELKAGPLLIKHTDQRVEKFFISSGFSFMTKDSFINVNVVEAVKFAELDSGEATKAFKQAEADLATAQTNEAKIKAQIEIETLNNVLLEVGSKQ